MPGINIGVDLGTSNVRFFVEGKGLALTENAVTATDVRTGKTLALGSKAYRMIGRTPDGVQVHYPLRHGMVSDFTACQDLLRYYLQILCGNRIFKPNLVLSMPSSLTGLEQRTLLNIAASSGAAKTCLVEKVLASAIGAGVDFRKPRGTMIVDIGGGTTEIAVVTMGCLAQHESLQIAGGTFDEDIRRYIRRERDILIGRLTAEQIKLKIGCAYLRDAEIAIAVKGKSYLTGMPMLFEVTTTEVFLALREHLEQIVETVRSVLSRTSPELLGDIAESGICLTGCGALLPGLAGCIERKTQIPAFVADDPANCTVRGIGKTLDHMDILSGSGYFFKAAKENAETA